MGSMGPTRPALCSVPSPGASSIQQVEGQPSRALLRPCPSQARRSKAPQHAAGARSTLVRLGLRSGRARPTGRGLFPRAQVQKVGSDERDGETGGDEQHAPTFAQNRQPEQVCCDTSRRSGLDALVRCSRRRMNAGRPSRNDCAGGLDLGTRTNGRRRPSRRVLHVSRASGVPGRPTEAFARACPAGRARITDAGSRR